MSSASHLGNCLTSVEPDIIRPSILQRTLCWCRVHFAVADDVYVDACSISQTSPYSNTDRVVTRLIARGRLYRPVVCRRRLSINKCPSSNCFPPRHFILATHAVRILQAGTRSTGSGGRSCWTVSRFTSRRRAIVLISLITARLAVLFSV